MEFLFPAFLLFCLFLPLPLLLLVTRKASSQISGINLPPGNTGWPVIGESLQFLKAGREGTPEKFINERMQLFSTQIFKTSLFAESTAVFCGPSGNKFLYSNENKLVTAWWPRSVDKIFPFSQKTSNKEEAMKMRKLLPSFLKPEALQRYIGTMDMVAKTHLQTGWHNKDIVMVFPLANDYAFSLACRLFLSIDDPQVVAKFAGPFAHVASAIISIPLDLPGTPFNRGLKAANFIRKELHTIIKQRKIDLAEKKASPTQDILSHMLLTTDENGELMNEMDIASKILGLLIGGHDTTTVAITFIVNYLAELPDIYNEVLREQMEIAKSKKSGDLLNWEDVQKMRYSWNVACEVMRLAPPVQGSFREAITDFTFAGFSIPKGWKLYWSANSTHRNPDYFADPEKFDPSRFEGKGPAPYTYVPFGGGPRMCPGKEYARLEILVFMHNLVRKFRWDKLLKDEKIVVDPMPIPAKGLPVRLLPHDHRQINSLCID